MSDEVSAQSGEGNSECAKSENLPDSGHQSSIFHTAIHLIDDNILHFHEDETEQGQRLYSGLRALRDGLFRVVDVGETVRKECYKYDFRYPDVPGNGFRSFSNMVEQAIFCVFEMCKTLSTSRDSILLFRKSHYVKEVEAWGQTLASLSTLLEYLDSTLLPRCVDGNLMPEFDYSPTELLSLLNTVSQYSFYGRCLGFHYYESLHKTLKFLNISMCAFSEVYYSDGGFMQRTKQSLFTSGKYMMDPEKRARRIVDVIQYSSVDFIKSFWSLADTELLAQLPSIVGPSLNVHQPIVVPCEDVNIHTIDNRLIVIPAPQSHIPPSPIPCFLLSYQMREGMPGEKQHKGPILPPSDKIIFHCHGGGFVTQSTKAQEVYLREWAMSLGVPIFSVDYSLAPDAKYPRPLEEVLTSYIWMLNNFKLLGTTGSRIFLTGDSAGGNLVTALTIRCLELGIRPPDGLFLIYTPFTVKIQPTPARLLAITDPLLPLGFALRCLKAYAGLPSNRTSAANSTSEVSSSIASPTSTLESTPEHSELDFNRSKPDVIKPVPVATKSRKKNKKSPNKSPSQPNGTIATAEIAVIKPEPESSDHKTVEVETQVTANEKSKNEKLDDNETFVEVPEHDFIVAEKDLGKSKSFVSEPETDTMTTVSLTSEPASLKIDECRQALEDNHTKEERSKKYVSEFLEKYVLDSKIDKEGRKVPILRTGSEELEEESAEGETSSLSSGITAKLGRAKDVVMDGLTAGWTSLRLRGKSSSTPAADDSGSPTSPTEEKIPRKPSYGRISLGNAKLRRDSSCSLLEEFIGVEVFSDHYINPINAPESILRKFPKTSMLVSILFVYLFCRN
ncbi:Hormone-sensitive lipase, partial [Armadillidium vulgare]